MIADFDDGHSTPPISALALPAVFWLYLRLDRARFLRQALAASAVRHRFAMFLILAYAVANRRGAAAIFRKYSAAP
jgi:hypothetical protein